MAETPGVASWVPDVLLVFQVIRCGGMGAKIEKGQPHTRPSATHRLVGVFRLKEQELGDHQVAGVIVNGAVEADHALTEEPGGAGGR